MSASTLDDVLTIESEDGSTHADHLKAMQRLINSGTAWILQGSYGRSAMQAIEEGSLMLGTTAQKDYWGTVVPSRFDVEPGTKGSRQFVIDHHDEAWVDMLEDL